MNNRYYSLSTNEDDRTADLYIFGDIVDAQLTGIENAFGLDIGHISGMSIVNDLKDLDVDLINVHINSCGGYTSEGLAIYNTLKNHSAKIITYCDGFACSAASIVFMAGDERVMGTASALMIHNAWCEVQGNAAQLKQQAAVLEKISQSAGDAYAEKVNISRDELDRMLDGENHEGSWINSQEAVDMGFATSTNSEKAGSSIANQSAKQQIMQKIFAKSKPIDSTPVEISVDIDKLADALLSRLTKPGQKEKTTNYDRLKKAFERKD